MDYKITIVLDKRNETANGFPAKLRVYDRNRKVAKLYTLNKYYSEKDFANITSAKPSKKNEEEAIALNFIKSSAENVASKIPIFNFEDFQKKFFSNHSDDSNLVDVFNQKINELFGNEQIKTAENYQSALKSIKSFVNDKNPENVNKIHILDITEDWLNKYERNMINKGCSYNTVGIYLRYLRCIYNMAIELNQAYKDHYPFAKNKYVIPASQKTKRALKKDVLESLYNAPAKTPQQQKAKDFWFLSYVSNGLNINDIAKLKFKHIIWDENKIVFYRGKSIRTSKARLKERVILLTDYTKSIIEKYKKEKTSDEDYVFPILKSHDAIGKKKDIDNFVRFINQHLKKLAEANGITKKVSTYWARHSFSTVAVNNGASIEYVSEALGHNSISTTMNYLNGFYDENKQKIISKISDFL